jgi:hypothetical protein
MAARGIIGHSCDMGWFGSNPVRQSSLTERPTANQRRHGRVLCSDVSCAAGEVVDLSASGARVRGSTSSGLKRGDRVQLSIRGLDTSADVTADIVWATGCGWRKQELGIQFVGIDEQTRVRMLRILRTASSCELLRPAAESW